MTDATFPNDHEDWTRSLFEQLGERSLRYLDERAMAKLHENDVTAGPGAGDWLIGAYVDEGSYEEINTYAREEVEQGAQALLFRLYRQPDTRDIRRILKEIDAAGVGLHCALRYAGQDPAELFRDLVKYLRAGDYDLRKVSGSVDFDPLLDWSDPPFPPLVRLLAFVSRWMPKFRVLQVNAAGFNNGADLADAELALALAKGAEYLKEVRRHGFSAEVANRHLQFALTVGTSYHGDVAKIRALRILWKKVLNELDAGAGRQSVAIVAHTDVTALSSKREANERNLLHQAHAAATGGADIIFLTPLEQVDETPTPRARKYAINTQLALQNSLRQVADPDHLAVITDALVAATWSKYQRLAAQGGFATAVEL